MKNNENDIIDIPTELEIEKPEEKIETLELIDEIDNSTVTSFESEKAAEINNEVPEILSPTIENAPDTSIKQNDDITQQSILSDNNLSQTEPRIESIDGNPDVLDIEVKNLEPANKPKSKKGLKIIFIIFLILVIAGGAVFAYYKFFVSNKTDEPKKESPKLQVRSLSAIYSFEEAYNQKIAEFNTKSEGKETLYEIENGSIKLKKDKTQIFISIEETRITGVSYLTEYKDNEVIAIKDSSNNYYFAHINPNLEEDYVLNYENNNLIKINNEKNISNISVARYLNSDEIFYIAIKNGQNNFIAIENGEVIDISSINLNIYNGINIDISDLKINEEAKNKVKINGVGLYYDGSLYLYKGPIKDISDIEIKNNDESFNSEKIFVVYNEALDYFDLYIINYDGYLFKINLLNVDIDTQKVDIKKYENKISEYTIFENDVSSVDIVFENGETIKLK